MVPRFEAGQLISYSRCPWPTSALSRGTRSLSPARLSGGPGRGDAALSPLKPAVDPGVLRLFAGELRGSPGGLFPAQTRSFSAVPAWNEEA